MIASVSLFCLMYALQNIVNLEAALRDRRHVFPDVADRSRRRGAGKCVHVFGATRCDLVTGQPERRLVEHLWLCGSSTIGRAARNMALPGAIFLGPGCVARASLLLTAIFISQRPIQSDEYCIEGWTMSDEKKLVVVVTSGINDERSSVSRCARPAPAL